MKEIKCIYNIFKMILSPIFKLIFKPTIINKEYIPLSGPIIICGNHLREMDPVLVALSTKRMVHFLAKKELYNGIKKIFFKAAGTIRVDRDKKDAEAISSAIQCLNNGYIIGIFPEGTRNTTNEILLPFKFGAVSMAKKTGAKIVPFCITGKSKDSSKNLKIVFDKPFEVGNMDLEKANNLLYKKIEALLLENK